jgi:1-acyl-sn-glycerol-3-phosphate acyltransferase
MRTIILLLIYVLLTILMIPVVFICFLFGWPKPLIWAGKRAMGIGPWILGIRVEVAGMGKLQSGSSYVFMSNHLSFLDGPLLFLAIPQAVRIILKKGIFRIPVVGWAMRIADFVPVDRKGFKGGRMSIEKASQLIREKRYSFLIFPEGTRSRDGKLQAFRRGGFFLALQSKAPIVPVSILGTFELMPRGSFFVKKGKIKVIVHAPVLVSGYDTDRLSDLSDRVRGIIRSDMEDKGPA